ncbi:hypothetical protein GCM10022223_17720 [Kineosporia mesophila]|uniref:Uncharacterized protein n=1 Tax=Kineosporia mesophila TaxID=566012 RepID=A0ABP6ZA91_9ACTN|nr:hypothetical protein [Kineosporia mesophila]MCD5351990.1 hypothetical protein [Kineosporia mesophila]
MGREEILVGDDVTCSVLALEFVLRSEDVTVWFGNRTLAVMDRGFFAQWLCEGGDYVVDDLAWTVEGRSVLLTIDGNRTYAVTGPSLRRLAHRCE